MEMFYLGVARKDTIRNQRDSESRQVWTGQIVKRRD